MASADLRDELTCSICLNIYTEPVTLTCGHSFCRTCIEDAMEVKEGPGAYKCPECRAKYKEHTALEKNRKLRNIAETFRSSNPEQEDVGILCTYCDSLAVKTCLLCDTSLCEKHVMKHSKSAEHVLMEPTASLENRTCPIHKKVLEYYCLEDATCVCVSCCRIGEHRGHQMESLHEASEKKKEKMQNILGRLISEKTKNENRSQGLQVLTREVEDSIAEITGGMTLLFMGTREQLETLEKRVLSQINRYGDKFTEIFSGLKTYLEIKMEELSRKVGHIEELCNTTDPLAVLQGFKLGEKKSDVYSKNFNKSKNSVAKESDEDDCFEHHDIGGDELKDIMISGIEGFGLVFATFHTGLDEVVTWVRRPYKAEEASHKSQGINMTSNILLNVNTAGNNAAISGDGKTMTFSNVHQGRPEGPERFKISQVLSYMGFSAGDHYWEVEGSPSGGWRVGVSYPSIRREGVQAVIGNNNKSWALEKNANNEYIAIHDNQSVLLPVAPSCYRLGIYLDYRFGLLSIYELGNPIRLLHTFKTSFTELLYFAIFVRDDGWVRIRR